MWDFKLIKQAKKKRNTKIYAHSLNEKDTDISFRHMLPPAQLEALRGGSRKAQVESNWDGLKLGLGSMLGTIGGGLAGTVAGAAMGQGMGGHRDAQAGAVMGAITGALGGGWLGNYLTFKRMAENRNVDADYGWRHLTPFGMPAQLAALQGYDPAAQVVSNIDNIKLGVPAVAGGLAGYAGGGYAAGPAGAILGGLAGNQTGALTAYKLLKSDRLPDDDDED